MTSRESTATVTWSDYARAEQFLPWNASKRIFNAEVKPNWLGETDRFWYRRTARDGASFVLVDPATGESKPAFDHVRLAASLSQATGTPQTHTKLPFEKIKFADGEAAIEFDAADKRWRCDLTTYDCTEIAKEEKSETEVRSPDDKWAAFVRDHNLFLRAIDSGEERQLTTDGAPFYAYAARPGSTLSAVTDKVIGRPAIPELKWSPDSTRFVTYRLDERNVRDMHLLQAVPTDGTHRPVDHPYRMPLVGDEHVAIGEFFVVDAESGAVTALQVPPGTRFTRSPFEGRALWWEGKGARLYALEHERGGRAAILYLADPATGTAKKVVEERGETLVYPHHVPFDNSNIREVGDGEAVLWFSQRDGWGHLYRYDTASGERTAQLTSGAWTVRETPRVDTAGGWIYFTAGGREAGRDPYYRHLYRIPLDGGDPVLLTPEDAEHGITLSPTGAYFVDNYSRVDLPPVSVLRRADGSFVCQLEEADVSALTEMGWPFPERFSVKARDGVTDIYGIIFRPSNYDPNRRYPVLDALYPGPQTIRAPKAFGGGEGGGRNFWQDQALAELGFVVINIDGFGTPYRSKAFIDVAYGKDFGEAGGLEDHIVGFRQLAARDSSLDLERVGIYGHSGGGYASARGMLLFPDFFKVAVSSAGNHDQRGYSADWGERYIGMPDGDNYDYQGNFDIAKNLRGKLLLVHGELDDNVHPGLTLRLADALIAANKDFDLLIIPFTNHGFFDLRWGRKAADRFISLSHPYFVRKRWDYFVKHLLNADPPEGYAIQRQAD